MELWIGAISLGLLLSLVAIGTFISFRINDFPDITVDGSFTSGAAIAAIMISSGYNPWLTLPAAFIVGAIAGAVTAFIAIRLKIHCLLAGILVMTALYSVNLHLMGRSNIPLLNKTTLLSMIKGTNPGMHPEIWTAIVLAIFVALVWAFFARLFRTDFGIALQAVGNNPTMASALGINVHRMQIISIMLSNGLVAVSGCLVAQHEGFADIGMGIGTIVIGFASVILGESLLNVRSIQAKLLCVIAGSVIFRLMIAVALFVGMNPIDLKLLTAGFVLLTLVISKTSALGKISLSSIIGSKMKLVIGISTAVAILIAILLGGFNSTKPIKTETSFKIGIVQFVENQILNDTRDGLLQELHSLGYNPGANTIFYVGNALGDYNTVSSIIDKFIQKDVDIIIPIGTPSLQIAVQKVSDRPIVFSTIANPIILGAGKTYSDHLPNITGICTPVPMDEMLEIAHTLMPGKLKIGSIWNPGQPNSVFNSENLIKAVDAYSNISFVGTNITSTADISLGAQSLVNKGINAFVLSPDNQVLSALDAIIKASQTHNIPIFACDADRLGDGLLCTVGFNYSYSGAQAAHLVDRVLKGESPANIPFENLKHREIGINLDQARKHKINIPEKILQQATVIFENGKIRLGAAANPTPKLKQPLEKAKKLVIFLFNENELLVTTQKGIHDELKRSGILDFYGITVKDLNAQNDFTMAQLIAGDIVRQKFDYIVTVSTPALQVTANANKTVPHIFGAVTDPYRMGVADDSKHHRSNITGVATLQPVDSTVRTMREMLPSSKRIGIIWNPAEACSEACTLMLREAAKKYNYELLETTVSNTVDIDNALHALIARGIDIFITSGDNTVMLAAPHIASVLLEKKIPYFTNTPSDIEIGSIVSIGADYYDVGRETAKILIRVIHGENPADIPINDYVPTKIFVNAIIAEKLGINLPKSLIDKASKVKRKK